MSEAKHTPTPWQVESLGQSSAIRSACGHSVAYTNPAAKSSSAVQRGVDAYAEQTANAEFIVRACNSHDELLAALKAMAAIYDGLDDALVHQAVMDKVNAARAVIAKAEGRS